jgi:hypothetical protein
MATPPAVIVASAITGVALATLATAITTLQAAATASRERAVGSVVVTGAPTGTAATHNPNALARTTRGLDALDHAIHGPNFFIRAMHGLDFMLHQSPLVY